MKIPDGCHLHPLDGSGGWPPWPTTPKMAGRCHFQPFDAAGLRPACATTAENELRPTLLPCECRSLARRIAARWALNSSSSSFDSPSHSLLLLLFFLYSFARRPTHPAPPSWSLEPCWYHDVTLSKTRGRVLRGAHVPSPSAWLYMWRGHGASLQVILSSGQARALSKDRFRL